MAIELHADTVRATRSYRPDAMLLAGVAIVLVSAAVLGLLARQGPVVALGVAGLLTFSVAAVATPRGFRIAAYMGLAALPFITAWPSVRPDEYSYPTYFAAFALALVCLGAFQPRMLTASLGTAFLAYISISSAVSLVWEGDLQVLPRYSVVLLAFAMYTLVRRGDAAERRLVVALVMVLGVIQAAIAVAQSFTGWPIFDAVLPALLQSQRNYFAYLVPGVSTSVTQGSGTFSHFNALGALLSICLPLAVGMWLERRSSAVRLIAALVVSAGMIATFSRGALLGGVAGTVFVLWGSTKHSRRATVVLVLCVAVLAAFFSLSVASQYVQSTANLGIRVQTWRTALDDALDAPSNLALGYGYGHFRTDVLAAGLGGASMTRASGFMASLHSGYLQLLLEFGVLGFVLFVAWLVGVFEKARREGATRVVPALGGVVGLLSSQVLDNALFAFAGVVLVVLVAVIEGELQESRHSRPSTASSSAEGRTT